MTAFDPRQPEDRVVDEPAAKQLACRLQHVLGDCGYLQMAYDGQTPAPLSLPHELSDEMADEGLAPSREIDISSTTNPSHSSADEHQKHLYSIVDTVVVDDNLVVEQKVLDEAFLKMMEKEKIAPVDIDKLD